jgi:hypothetical protein
MGRLQVGGPPNKTALVRHFPTKEKAQRFATDPEYRAPSDGEDEEEREREMISRDTKSPDSTTDIVSAARSPQGHC